MKRRKIRNKRKERKKNVKDRNEVDIEKSNIPGMHKGSKNKDTIKPDLAVSVKVVKIER